ncbi:KGG domain-containing protein [Variovorax ureilyticus]|uniref:KGG domain-containing protein n=1 Tax=Variovorax ureilyticus TaxID=1836198 RepID=UPI003BF4FB08
MTLQDDRDSGQPMAPRGRGFAGMDPTRQRDIAREGGRAAHEKGTAHEFTSEEARAAGQKSRMNRLAREAARQA